MKRILSLWLTVVIVLVPWVAFGQEVPGETVIVPDVVPPAGTDWPALVALGAAYVFMVVELAAK